MTIFVYGATGRAGRLVAEALVRRGHDVIAAGRDPERTRAAGEALGVSWRSADAGNPEALARAMKGVSIACCCAGPHSQVGEPLLRAALDAGAHYADLAGEQAYARRVYERYESRARRARRAIVSGLAFEPALADWAAAAAAAALGPGRIDEVAIAYAVSRIPLTHGMAGSLRAALASPTSVWAHDRWEEAAPGGQQALVRFPAPFGERLAILAPLAAAITIPRHVDTAAARTFVAAGRASRGRRFALTLAAAAAPALSAVARSPLAAELGALATGDPAPADLDGARVAVVAEARRGFERARVALTGTDPYRLTAEIAALAVPALEHREGALAPAEIVEPGAALEALRARASLGIERGS